MQVRAAVLHTPTSSTPGPGQPGPFRIETLELEGPRAGEVRVRVRAAGVCHSDWHVASGASRHPLPVVCGHEGAGVVEELGPGVESVRVGDAVALNWSPYCGTCFYCTRGQRRLCSETLETTWAGALPEGTSRFSRGGEPVFAFCALGCFAEQVVVHASACVGLGHDLDPSLGALIGCAVTTGVGAVVNSGQARRGESVVVYGVGGVGESALLGAQLVGAAPIVAVDPSPARRERALQLGADAALAPEPSPLEALRDMTGGRGFDIAVEAVGQPGVQEACVEATRPGGRVVLAGLAPMGSQTNLAGARLTREEKTVTGCYYGGGDAPDEFPRLAQLASSGRLDLARLIERTYELEQINEAYADLLSARGGRGIILLA